MNVFTRLAASALIATAFGTAATAENWIGARVEGSGENASVVYGAPSANVVGGALTRETGSGESADVQVLDAQAAQAGRVGRVIGSGENASVVYEPAPALRAQSGASFRG